MCGIAGWIDVRGASPGVTALTKMADAIRHRGPDGDGIALVLTKDGKTEIALAHRRLAIIDLSGGRQPMESEDGTIVLVFNGEIYNFRELRAELETLGHHFRTDSDTEVLIEGYRAWGTDCVNRFRGMFAFALWDSNRERLFLSRDRFGKKPLFYKRDGARIVFGSEIKSILAHPGIESRLDQDSVWDYLAYRYVPGPHTFFKDIAKLPPGSSAVWENGEFTIRGYYAPPDATVRPNGHAPADPIKAFSEKLDECIRIRMVSDVPFGAFLSGGLDSSAVVAVMSRHSNHPVKTFSVGYKEADYSEFRYAKMVSDKFGTDHHELEISADSMMDWMPKLIHFRDGPVAETADIPIYLLSVEASKTVKMVLTGEGSDEILGGYPKHRFEPLAASYHKLVPELFHNNVVEPVVNKLPYKFRRIKTLAASLGLRDPRDRMPRWFGALAPADREAIANIPPASRPLDERPFQVDRRQSALRQILHFDQTSWLPDNLLERGDRMTMAGSIEGRMPFMDHELAAFMAELPDKYRIRGGEQKWILRRAMAKILPDTVLNRPKVGFRVPVNEWFRGKMKGFLQDHLLGAGSLTSHYYRRPELERVLSEHTEGRANHEKLLWMLLSLELFQREYRLA